MRIAFITSGAAGMYCGSCMKDNALAVALNRQGHDALLIPTYTPIRTDEEDISQHRIFFGGINIYLEQKSWIFRHTPWILDRMLNSPRLLRWVSRFAMKTQADQLGDLSISMLEGKSGKQRKEIDKLLSFLQEEAKPEAIVLSNLLISGLVPYVEDALNVPVLGTLQGDDIFLEALPANHRRRCIELIRENSRTMVGHFATSTYYADFMAGYLGLERENIHVVYPGLNMKGHGGSRETRSVPPYTIGYFARICPEKGLQHLIDAFLILRRSPGAPSCRLLISGWLGENNQSFLNEQMSKVREAGLSDDVEHVHSPDHAGKVAFMKRIDVLSVPTRYREPKGIYVLEALANGTPVVQPRHGSFPELIARTSGGFLVEPDDPSALALGLRRILEDIALRRECGEKGQAAVREYFTDDRMALATINVLKKYIR